MAEHQGQRLKEFRVYEGKTQKEFADIIKVEQPHLSQVEQGKRNISSTMLEDIAKCYKHLNLDWLVRGRGAMFLLPLEMRDFLPSEAFNNFLVPASAHAGGLIEWTQEWMDQNLEPVVIPGLSKLSGELKTFEVEGDSMEPTFNEGDFVVGRRIERAEDLKRNHVHILVTKSGICIKRIILVEGFLILESDNEIDHPPTSVPLNEVYAFYYAVMKLTRNLSGPRPVDARITRVEKFLHQQFKTKFLVPEDY